MKNAHITPLAPDSDVEEGGTLASDQTYRGPGALPFNGHDYDDAAIPYAYGSRYIRHLLREQEENERRKMLAREWNSRGSRLCDNVNNSRPLPQEILLSLDPSIFIFPSARKWLDDVPRPTPNFGLVSEHDTVALVDRHFPTKPAVMESLRQAKTDITNAPEYAGPPSLSLDSLFTTQCPSHVSTSTQTPSLLSPLSSNSISDHTIFCDVTAKDPEALLDTQNLNVTDMFQTDPNIIATALITALGLLTSHTSNPKVAVFQLSAAAVSFTLIALHSFHSKTLADTHLRETTLVQRLLKWFPPFIFASCWILFLLSIIFTFPKPMSVAVCLVVFASIPMLCGARLPAALTLAIITLFTLTFFTLVVLVCVLPTEWLA